MGVLRRGSWVWTAAVVGGLAGSAGAQDAGPLPGAGAEADTAFAEARAQIRRTPRELVRLLPEIERRDGERWVRLVADDAVDAAAASGLDAPILLEHVARSLGRWWSGAPHLRVRVPALVRLARYPKRDVQLAAIAGIERCAFQPVTNPVRWGRTWPAFVRRHRDADDAGLIIALLAERRAGAAEPDRLAADVAPRLAELGRPGVRWATPVLLDAFGWAGGDWARVRAAAIVAVRRTGDPAAVAPLVALVQAAQGDDQMQAAAITAIGELAGDPAGSVETILRGSLREGRPLPRRAAAVALGQLRVAGAVDELLAYGDQAASTDASEAWRAVARIGGARAEAELLARCPVDAPGGVASVVRALGQWPTLPVPTAIAERLAGLWWVAFGAAHRHDASWTPLREALCDAAFAGPVEGAAPDAQWRGVAHPRLADDVRALALATDVALQPLTDAAFDRWLSTGTDADRWSVVHPALVRAPDDRRGEAALRWAVAHPDPARRDDLCALLADETRPRPFVTAIWGLLDREDTWDDDACWPLLAAWLRRATAGDWELLKVCAEIASRHPVVARVPDVIALLPTQKGEDDLRGMQVGNILFRWGLRTVPGGPRWPDRYPPLRRPWREWWDDHGARVRFR